MFAVPTLIGEVSIRLFVRHGDQQNALDFYGAVFGAQLVGRPYLHQGVLIAAEIRLGESVIMIVGANPKRDADASLGGPRSAHAIGATPVMLDIHVDDADRIMHHAVAEGARVRNAVETLDNGDRAGVLVDPFGHLWVVKSRRKHLAA
ncbi:VOC family protein [Phyllobacterium sp. 21LDTY02-6]|jgi:PhnB protein|uniref:VOC family protein n=1 Tax=unclassified Phyllobacterium TaxID=2638441 RepID=UPI002021E296|nr:MULTISPECIES: VOC family protein [unclassified Phyllobacterium]MCO4318782.1 VOC family protein [Phyllobacterium sp. 21LDTY02-6]MCX8281951.1 VOC family protein [Phyllobacterium sp. 0TCS1.6C]MCX8294414.1 VOC family protein [Phyllobacterium sp. 0TCS1.6A]